MHLHLDFEASSAAAESRLAKQGVLVVQLSVNLK